jgi:hypothetical protein
MFQYDFSGLLIKPSRKNIPHLDETEDDDASTVRDKLIRRYTGDVVGPPGVIDSNDPKPGAYGMRFPRG